MAEYEESNGTEGLSAWKLAAAALIVGGSLLAVVTTVWALARFLELSGQSEPPPAPSDFLAAAVILLLCWGLGLLLWGAAEVLRRLGELHETLLRNPSVLPGADIARQPPRSRVAEPRAEQQARLLEELVELTREVRDIGLLSEPERARRLQSEAADLAQQLEHEVPALLCQHKWQEAQRLVRRASQRFPSLHNWSALEQQVEHARAKFEAHDLDVATREVHDLTALGAWDQAAEVVRDLRQRHPGSDKVTKLNRRVAIGRDKATAEERARLMSQAQEATDRHDWTEALRLVETLVARFPASLEARELRQQVPMLRGNVEIHIRQEMETAIRELIKEQQYAEALRVANKLIERYPDSPQAGVLRDQLPRLHQKAEEVPR